MNPLKVVLATRNPSKLLQIRELLAHESLELLDMDQAGIVGQGVEDMPTLSGNAIKKARYAQEELPKSFPFACWVVAEDTGLFLAALDYHEPGVISARWPCEGLSTECVMGYTLGRVHGKHSGATFRSVVVAIGRDGEMCSWEGAMAGIIAPRPMGVPQPKMPYSAIFVPAQGPLRSLAQMSTEEENAISHRGQAWRQAKVFLVQKAQSQQ